MPLTEGELIQIHAWVGDEVDDDELEERNDRLGSLDAVIVETLQSQLSEMLSNPSSMSTPDGMSVSFTTNLQQQQIKIDKFHSQGGLEGSATPPVATISRIVRPDYR